MPGAASDRQRHHRDRGCGVDHRRSRCRHGGAGTTSGDDDACRGTHRHSRRGGGFGSSDKRLPVAHNWSHDGAVDIDDRSDDFVNNDHLNAGHNAVDDNDFDNNDADYDDDLDDFVNNDHLNAVDDDAADNNDVDYDDDYDDDVDNVAGDCTSRRRGRLLPGGRQRSCGGRAAIHRERAGQRLPGRSAGDDFG
jgi:hypothetical protein